MQLSCPLLHTEQAISKSESQASHKLKRKQNVSRRDPFGLEKKRAKSYRGKTAMIADHISVSTSQWSEERALTMHLVLTTLAGDEAQPTIEIKEFDRLHEFEDAVMEQLPVKGESSTFGCELRFVCRNSQQKLVDPIWHTLRDCNCFTVVVSPCFEQAEHKGQMQGEAKALQVPFNDSDRIFPQAFAHVAKVRRVQAMHCAES